MNFGEVIKVMNNTKVFKCKREELAVNILKAAGIVIEVDMDFQTAVAKWIDRGIPKNICSYFPNAINEEELKKHIERWATDKTWKTLQRGFDDYNSKTKNQINKCIVNCSTSVREDFCQSIVVQLVESLGFPLPEKYNNKNTNIDPTTQPVLLTSIVNTTENIGAHISIPDNYRRCVFCTKWKGNASHANKFKSGVYGTCVMYNRDQLSTDGIDCKDFEPNEARISKQILLSQ